MNIDLLSVLVSVAIILTLWNIYISLSKKKDLSSNDDNGLADIKASISSQSSSLEGLIRDVASFQDPLSKLNRYLSGGTLAGSFGEWSLEAIITDIFPSDKFETNCEIISGSGQRVEFAIKLPDGLMPIDAKFPSALYDNYIDASNRGDKKSVEIEVDAQEELLLADLVLPVGSWRPTVKNTQRHNIQRT